MQKQFREFRRITQKKDEELRYLERADLSEIIIQKNNLESTLLTLTQEVDLLSAKNEQLLKDLKARDFY